MRCLVDTNILVRLSNAIDPDFRIATKAVESLTEQGWELCIPPQVLIEFWSVATRPLAVNGLGLSLAVAGSEVARFEAMFTLLEDTSDIFPAWKALVAAAGVVGKQVHDARLVAVCHAHGMTHLLTFNGAHFARLAGVGPGVAVVDPAGA